MRKNTFLDIIKSIYKSDNPQNATVSTLFFLKVVEGLWKRNFWKKILMSAHIKAG